MIVLLWEKSINTTIFVRIGRQQKSLVEKEGNFFVEGIIN